MQQPPSGMNYSDVVYAIFLSWPDDFNLQLGDVTATDQTVATLLGYSGPVKIKMKESGVQGINITLPYLPPNTPLQWAWTLKLGPVPVQRSL